MSMRGVITGRDVLLNTSLIVREFGPRTYVRCVFALLLRRRTTFLDCAFA